MKVKNIYIAAVGALLVTACTDLRDLYDVSDSVLNVTASWSHAPGEEDVQNGTVLLYRDDGTREKAYLSHQKSTSVRITLDRYDVAVFNGIMESESVTNLDHVYFRGTDRPATFEVYAAKASPLKRLVRTGEEYIASNEMEIFSFARNSVDVDRDGAFYIKYQNGKKTDNGGEENVVGTLESNPKALSFRFRVRLTGIVNPAGARSASGAMRGFLEPPVRGAACRARDSARPTI